MTKKQENVTKAARELANKAALIAQERNCTDITVLDITGISPATNYYVIATSTSGRQARTVTDEITEYAKKNGHQRFGSAGYEQGRWVLTDFVDVVVHIFDEQYREYYNLEMLWGDAKHLDIVKEDE